MIHKNLDQFMIDFVSELDTIEVNARWLQDTIREYNKEKNSLQQIIARQKERINKLECKIISLEVDLKYATKPTCTFKLDTTA